MLGVWGIRCAEEPPVICVTLCRCCTCSISFTGTLPLPAHRQGT